MQRSMSKIGTVVPFFRVVAMKNQISRAARFFFPGLLGSLAFLAVQSQAFAQTSRPSSSSSSSNSGLGTSGTGQGLTSQSLLGNTNINSLSTTLGNSKNNLSSSNLLRGYYTNPYSLGV